MSARRTSIVVFSLIYWFFALTLGGLIATMFGDCFADQRCVTQKQWLSIAILGIGAVIYAILLARRLKRSRGRAE